MNLTVDRPAVNYMTTNLVLALETMCINEIAREMKEYNVGVIPIVDNFKSKRIVGIVTDRDIVTKVLGNGVSPLITTAGDIMTRSIFSCKPSDPVVRVIALMSMHRIRRIVILNEKETIVGIISLDDLASSLGVPGTTADLVECISARK